MFFVIGKSSAIDVGVMNTQGTINEFIKALYEHIETTLDAGNIDYFTTDI